MSRDLSDAALAADLAADAGKLLLAGRDRVGFDHPWLLGDAGDSQANALLLRRLHASRLDGSPLLYNQPDPYLPDLLMCRPEVADVLLGAIRQAG